MNYNQNSLKEIIDLFSIEKNLTNQEILSVVEESIKEVWQQTYGNYHIVVKTDDRGIRIFHEMTYVENVTDHKTEISIEGNYDNLGKKILQEVSLHGLSKIDMVNIVQKMKDNMSKKQMQHEYLEFKDSIGKVFDCKVIKHERNGIVVRVANKYDGILPYSEIQDTTISRRKIKFFVDEVIKCRLHDVKDKFTEGNISSLYICKHQLFFERKSTDFIKQLLFDLIPEISEGVVVVKKVTRVAGLVTKVLVSANEDNINPIGVCIGLYSQRRNQVIEILKGEKVDFVLYKQNVTAQVERCFAKCNIYKINLYDHKVQVVIEGNSKQLGYIIGMGKINIKILSDLIGYNLEVISLDDYKKQKDQDNQERLEKLIEFGISEKTAETIVYNYIDINNVLEDNTIPMEDQTKLKQYMEKEMEDKKQEFLDKGGSEDLFLYKQLPVHYYFQILKAGIYNKETLLSYKEFPEKLRALTGLNMDICLYLLE